MRTMLRTLRRALALRHLRNERGMLLVITLVILLVLSTFAAANLINSFLERSLARNQSFANVALQSADAGIAAGLTWLNNDTNFATLPTAAPWVWAGRTDSRTLFVDFAGTDRERSAGYTYTLAYKTDSQDLDGDGNTTEVVLYNKCSAGNNCFNFPDSLFLGAGEGYPVIRVLSQGRYGEGGYREVEMEVARNKFKIRANGALTAAANVNVTGNISVDGRSHDSNGNLGGVCGDEYPGVNVSPGNLVDSSGHSGGNLTGAGGLGTDSTGFASSSPDHALGLCDGNGDGDCDDAGEVQNAGGALDSMLGGLPAVNTCKSAQVVTYCNETSDHDVGANGTGILVVHNPLFDPRVFRVSVPVIPDPAHPTSAAHQIPNPNRDPTSPFYDPKLDSPANAPGVGLFNTGSFLQNQADAYFVARKPRNLTINGNITWKGAIIADSINPINGNATVIGAMISLTSVSLNVVGSGSATILYSCDALNLFGGQKYTAKLGWHRLR